MMDSISTFKTLLRMQRTRSGVMSGVISPILIHEPNEAVPSSNLMNPLSVVMGPHHDPHSTPGGGRRTAGGPLPRHRRPQAPRPPPDRPPGPPGAPPPGHRRRPRRPPQDRHPLAQRLLRRGPRRPATEGGPGQAGQDP